MAGVFSSRKWSKQLEGDELPAPKRISTPAGMRLSVIMNDSSKRKSLQSIKSINLPSPLPITKEGPIVVRHDIDVESLHKEPNSAKTTSTPHAYSHSVVSEKSVFAEEQPKRTRVLGPFGKKKCILLLGISCLLLVALVIGLAVGLTRKHSRSKTSPQPSSTTAGASSPTPSVILAPPVNLQNNFPVGTYSMYTFLDTIQTNCTSDPATWICSPNVIYNTNPTNALATFDFAITGSSGSYIIAPAGNSDAMNGLTFSPAPLKIVNQGQDSENYHFQIIFNKVVSTSLGGSMATCYYNAASFQGTLYTKTAKGYPLPGQSLPSPSNQEWPFAMRFEEDAGGGAGTPTCFTSDSKNVTDGIFAQTEGSLCSCLYKNWRTPTPS